MTEPIRILSPTNLDLLNDYRLGTIILVDKPLGWTSFDVVNKLRYKLSRITQVKRLKVGHNGTLDPLATGLLMIFVGKYTKLINGLAEEDKNYEGVIKLGCTTASLDTETEEVEHIAYPKLGNYRH